MRIELELSKVKALEVEERIEYAYDWDGGERESKDDIRYDWDNGNRSVWLRLYGDRCSIEGEVPKEVNELIFEVIND